RSPAGLDPIQPGGRAFFDGSLQKGSRSLQTRGLLLGRRVAQLLRGGAAPLAAPADSQRAYSGSGKRHRRQTVLPHSRQGQPDAAGRDDRAQGEPPARFQARNSRRGGAVSRHAQRRSLDRRQQHPRRVPAAAKARRVRRKYPDVKPILRISGSAGVVEEVIEGKVEIGYVGFKPADPRMALEKIWKDEMVLAIPRGHPWARRSSIDLAMLGAERFISRETGSGTLDSFRELLSDRGQTADDLLHVAMQLGSTEAVKQALLAGFGISILSRTSIQRELAEGALLEMPIEGFKMERDFYEVVYRQRPLSPAAQAFRLYLQTA